MKNKHLLLSLALCVSTVFAKESKNSYVGYMWSDSDSKPIIVPIPFNTKNECEQLLKEMNKITEKTIKVSRQYECNLVFTSKGSFHPRVK